MALPPADRGDDGRAAPDRAAAALRRGPRGDDAAPANPPAADPRARPRGPGRPGRRARASDIGRERRRHWSETGLERAGWHWAGDAGSAGSPPVATWAFGGARPCGASGRLHGPRTRAPDHGPPAPDRQPERRRGAAARPHARDAGAGASGRPRPSAPRPRPRDGLDGVGRCGRRGAPPRAPERGTRPGIRADRGLGCNDAFRAASTDRRGPDASNRARRVPPHDRPGEAARTRRADRRWPDSEPSHGIRRQRVHAFDAAATARPVRPPCRERCGRSRCAGRRWQDGG